jgi:hypothetical protein
LGITFLGLLASALYVYRKRLWPRLLGPVDARLKHDGEANFEVDAGLETDGQADFEIDVRCELNDEISIKMDGTPKQEMDANENAIIANYEPGGFVRVAGA